MRGSQTSKIASLSVLNDLMGLALPSAIVPKCRVSISFPTLGAFPSGYPSHDLPLEVSRLSISAVYTYTGCCPNISALPTLKASPANPPSAIPTCCTCFVMALSSKVLGVWAVRGYSSVSDPTNDALALRRQ